MNCPDCHFENRERAGFCGNCGVRLFSLCPQCGAESPAEHVFCDRCGCDFGQPREAAAIDYAQPQSYTPKSLADKILTTRNSIEGERKLVTVLFADVVNYTSISEKLDPEEVHQIMDGCFKTLMDEIHRYEGTIIQFTGDGAMALFGAPVAHEDHAQRACHAASSIQKAMKAYGEKIKKDRGLDFRMRVGLNSGTVIVGTIGDDLKMDYTAIGDTVNLASRMETMARPGSVLVSWNTHKLTREYFEFASLGKVAVKGKEKPQEAYELVRASAVETRIEASAAKGLTRFVGRGKELEALRVTLRKAHHGSGQVVGMVGEAGVGKSRLILELSRTISKNEYAFLQGQCHHYGGSMPYLPILDIVKSYFNIQEEDREDMIKRKVRERLGQLDEELLGSLAAYHELLSVQVEDERYLQLEPQERRQRTFEAIRDLVIRASAEKPLLVTVEDLHWIDRTSQEFLDYLIGWLANTSILLVLLYRPEYTHTWGGKSYYTQISLDQLSSRNSADLVQAILEEGEVVPELRDTILGRAGGNPLFVEELTHSLLENGSIHREDDHYVLARRPSEIQVPDTIQGIIAARMDRVEESLKRIMQVASVIGREFAYRILATITGMREDLKASLINLQGLEFIYEKQLFPELEYIFKHALTQEVAYNSLLLKRRREIHEKIGQAIEELNAERLEELYELLAYHYVRSDNKQKALEYLDLANRKTEQAYAVEDAKGYFDKAMELLDTLPDTEANQERRISLLANQSGVFFYLLKATEYHDLLTRYEPVAASLGNPGLLGTFHARLGYSKMMFGHFDQAIIISSKAAELLEAAGDTGGAGYALYTSAFAHLYRAEYDRALALKEDALRMLEAGLVRRVYVHIWVVASVACSQQGRLDEAVEMGEEALRKAQDYAVNSLMSWAAVSISAAYINKRDMARAIEYGEQAVAMAPTPGDKAFAQHVLAWALCHAGKTSEGIELLVGLHQVFRSADIVMLELPAISYLAEGYWLAGEYGRARQAAQESLELSEQCGARYFLGRGHRFLGEIALESKPDEAGPHFEHAISTFQEIKTENELALAYSGMGRLHKRQGDTEQAREYLTKALEIFDRLGTLIEPDKVRKELDGLAP